MKMRNVISCIYSDRVQLLLFIIFLILISLLYSGRLYLSHLNDGIAAGVVVDGVRHMLPGDHHSQFYRYSLFYQNLLRGRLPYYSGNQFASTEFSEGMIFFPFTAIVGLMSFLIGPVLAYNSMLLLSYVFVGLAGYYMVKQLTKSKAAGVVAGIFLATVPFRTSFLYGQMVYGVDAVILPLLIYIIERCREDKKKIYFFMSGLLVFFIVTANYQLFYWAMILLLPYFVFVIFDFIRSEETSATEKIKQIAWLIPGLIGCAFYAFYILHLMSDSTLQKGQNYAETMFYTPRPHNLAIRYNGGEKNVYLGYTALIVAPWLLSPLFSSRKRESRSIYIPLFTLLFLVGMFLIFGPVFDYAFKLPVYQWMFEHVPGFSGTRTTGRIMAVVVVFYAILLGFAVATVTRYINRRYNNLYSFVLVIALSCLIVWDFNYVKPGINTFEKKNKAYESIAGTNDKVVMLPFQLISAHYLNASFLTYALRYDLKILTGHSSIYPKIADEQVGKLQSLNNGFIDYDQWHWLKNNGYKYIAAHATQFEPKVGIVVISALHISPYLDFIMSDNGIYLYRVRNNVNEVERDNLGKINFDKWSKSIESLSDKFPKQENEIHYAYGWYDREVYPNQRPFRWMKSLESIIVLQNAQQKFKGLSFEYLCPYRTNLIVNTHKFEGIVKQEQLIDQWMKADIEFDSKTTQANFVTLKAERIYKSPPDIRIFGCMVGDISVR